MKATQLARAVQLPRRCCQIIAGSANMNVQLSDSALLLWLKGSIWLSAWPRLEIAKSWSCSKNGHLVSTAPSFLLKRPSTSLTTSRVSSYTSKILHIIAGNELPAPIPISIVSGTDSQMHCRQRGRRCGEHDISPPADSGSATTNAEPVKCSHQGCEWVSWCSNSEAVFAVPERPAPAVQTPRLSEGSLTPEKKPQLLSNTACILSKIVVFIRANQLTWP